MTIAFLIYIAIGSLDWFIKEFQCYPNKRIDTIFWRTVWAVLVYAVAFALVLLFTKPIYLLMFLTEDFVYYGWRTLVYREPLDDKFYLPFTLFGKSYFKMQTVAVVWGVSVVVVVLLSIFN